MKIGMIGLGKMGANMVDRLLRDGHQCVVYDLNRDNVKRVAAAGGEAADSLEDLARRLPSPRPIWMMVPAGEAVETTIASLAEILSGGDIVIDGGNSHYKDAVRRARGLREKAIHFLDVGTSGGVWGRERGYCLMIGGEREPVARLEPIFRTLAPGLGEIPRTPGREGLDSTAEAGFLHCGPPGAGHFVKMIHNGIEYGIMQAYAEGFDILDGAAGEMLPEEYRYRFDNREIAEVWRRGSVIGSWLLDLTAQALAEDPKLSAYTGYVDDSGEGRWTVLAAVEEAVPARVLTSALYARFRSRREHTFAEKVLSAMRQKFGGHVENPGEGE